jgi:Zn-dependent protease with chaperone function
MCELCAAKPISRHARWASRRGFMASGAALLAGFGAAPAQAQVDVGQPSSLRKLVPVQTLENAAARQYAQMLAQAQAQQALAPEGHPQLARLRHIAQRLVPFAGPWNERARGWRWEVNLIGSKQLNAFCLPGGKIAFFRGILDQLQLNDDEVAMVMGHEIAHAVREHARARLAKTQATGIGLALGAQLLGLGQIGELGANLGTQLLALQYSREDESEADLVGLELAARGGFEPRASVTLWQKMTQASGAGPGSLGGGGNGLAFLSTHPSGPNRVRELEANVPKVQALYQRSRKS